MRVQDGVFSEHINKCKLCFSIAFFLHQGRGIYIYIYIPHTRIQADKYRELQCILYPDEPVDDPMENWVVNHQTHFITTEQTFFAASLTSQMNSTEKQRPSGLILPFKPSRKVCYLFSLPPFVSGPTISTHPHIS